MQFCVSALVCSYVVITYTCLKLFTYIAAQDQPRSGKTDGRSIAITTDQHSVNGVCEGEQNTDADSGAIKDVSKVFKDLIQAGKAGLTCVHVYSNH